MRKVDPLSLGRWVRFYRKAKKLTQAQLAELAGITRYQLIRIENGESKTTAETACALAVALERAEGEALRLAGFDGEAAPDIDVRLAREIEPYLMQLRPEQRPQAEQMLVRTARDISEMLAAR